MISLIAQNPSTPNFKRNLNHVEKQGLRNYNLRTFLDVAIKTGQGIITPKEGAAQDLEAYIQKITANPHGTNDTGHLGPMLRAFGQIDHLKRSNRANKMFDGDDMVEFEQKSLFGMFKAAFDLGRRDINHDYARRFFEQATEPFPPNFTLLKRLIPIEIKDAPYVVKSSPTLRIHPKQDAQATLRYRNQGHTG